MEIPTVDTSAAIAKCDLLARLRNNPPPWFAALSGDEFSAQIDARIDAARMPHARGRAHCLNIAASDDDDEPVEAAPVPRRQRKRSLAKVCEAARKAGADRVIVDGVVIVLSPAAAVLKSDANEWDAVLSEVDHGPH